MTQFADPLDDVVSRALARNGVQTQQAVPDASGPDPLDAVAARALARHVDRIQPAPAQPSEPIPVGVPTNYSLATGYTSPQQKLVAEMRTQQDADVSQGLAQQPYLSRVRQYAAAGAGDIANRAYQGWGDFLKGEGNLVNTLAGNAPAPVTKPVIDPEGIDSARSAGDSLGPVTRGAIDLGVGAAEFVPFDPVGIASLALTGPLTGLVRGTPAYARAMEGILGQVSQRGGYRLAQAVESTIESGGTGAAFMGTDTGIRTGDPVQAAASAGVGAVLGPVLHGAAQVARGAVRGTRNLAGRGVDYVNQRATEARDAAYLERAGGLHTNIAIDERIAGLTDQNPSQILRASESGQLGDFASADQMPGSAVEARPAAEAPSASPEATLQGLPDLSETDALRRESSSTPPESVAASPDQLPTSLSQPVDYPGNLLASSTPEPHAPESRVPLESPQTESHVPPDSDTSASQVLPKDHLAVMKRGEAFGGEEISPNSESPSTPQTDTRSGSSTGPDLGSESSSRSPEANLPEQDVSRLESDREQLSGGRPAVEAEKSSSPSPNPTKSPSNWLDETGVKHALNNKDREFLGMAALDNPERQSNVSQLADARAKGIPDRALDIATESLRSNRPLTAVEQMGMADRMLTIKHEISDSLKALDTVTDPGEIAGHSATLDRLQDDFEHLSEAVGRGGTEAGRALQARARALNEDYSLATIKALHKAKSGKDLTPAEKTFYEQKITALEAAVESHKAAALKVAEEQAERHIRRQPGRKIIDPRERAARTEELASRVRGLLKQGCL